MNAGLANESAVSQMEATYYQVQGSVLDLQQQINQVENSLALLLAETPRNYERRTLADQQFPTDFAVGIPVRMLAARPDVRSAERTLEAAFYGTNAARSAFYPSITLSGSAGWTNSVGSMILNPGKFLASAVGSLTQPLLNKGQVVAQYRIARAQQEEAALGFQQTLLNAGSEVNDALTAYQTSRGKDLARQADCFSANSRAKYFSADGTYEYNLSGSTYRPTVIAQRATITDGQSFYRNTKFN